MRLHLIVCAVTTAVTSSAFGDIYNIWGTWLSDIDPAPYTNFINEELRYADLVDTDLSYSTFTESIFYGSHFQGSDLSGAVFDHTEFDTAYFNGANLTGAVFVNLSSVEYANFQYSELSAADLSGAHDWWTATWNNATYDINTIFPDGMNPDDYGMIYSPVPAPAAVALLGLAGFSIRRRRRVT
mgnify:FL=1